MSKWIPQVSQVPRHQIRSRRTNGKMVGKKLVATTVSSREMGQRCRDEGKTASSHINTATQRNQGSDRCTSGRKRQKLKQVDGVFPVCMTRGDDDTENRTRRNEDLKGKEGGRLKLCNVDGDVPKCLRSFDEENKDSRQQQRFRTAGRTTAEAKNQAVAKICAATLQKKSEIVTRTKGKDTTFIEQQKNMRSLHSSERIEEMVCECELEGYRWDAILMSETWRPDKSEIWRTHQKNFFLGSRKL